MSCTNRDNFTSFLIQMPFISFSCLLSLARTCSTSSISLTSSLFLHTLLPFLSLPPLALSPITFPRWQSIPVLAGGSWHLPRSICLKKEELHHLRNLVCYIYSINEYLLANLPRAYTGFHLNRLIITFAGCTLIIFT